MPITLSTNDKSAEALDAGDLRRPGPLQRQGDELSPKKNIIVFIVIVIISSILHIYIYIYIYYYLFIYFIYIYKKGIKNINVSLNLRNDKEST